MERASLNYSTCSKDHSVAEKIATTKDWNNSTEKKRNLFVKSEDNGTSQHFNADQQCYQRVIVARTTNDAKKKTIKINPEKIFVPQTISTPAASNSLKNNDNAINR